jgi:hypothetical protein
MLPSKALFDDGEHRVPLKPVVPEWFHTDPGMNRHHAMQSVTV